jgi:hypothetical protein
MMFEQLKAYLAYKLSIGKKRKELKNLYKRAYKKRKIVDSPIKEGWDNFDWVAKKTKSKVELLKAGLDDESCRLIDLFAERHKKSFVWSQEELTLFDNSHLAPCKYKFAKLQGYQPEVFYFKNGLCFIENEIEKNLKGKCVIDGGSCCGDSALMFQEYDVVDKVYAFEPMSQTYEGLVNTLKMNKVDRVCPLQIGLSDHDGKEDILDESCDVTTIDSFAKDKKIGCIKMDLEGCETKAIEGAMETIKRDNPILLICIYHNPTDFLGIKPKLEALGTYKFIIRDTEPCNQGAGCHLMLIGIPKGK